ncbi:AIPR family protein [Chromobacterium violaceum]|uniref:AIPR family protein n=1 Tax=Chromobacterium violaceum TaxID=536 RepID=UPI00143DF925|nr:AIPR family protein [Chromobacterium violaceum]QIY78556.1 AIPR family protein [Chromobacterium violaceum]
MINLKYPNILSLFSKYIDNSKRSESASFLIWYLENYFRLSEIDAVDSVCDQRGDKGIDGIYYSEGESILYIFQSKISQKEVSSVGDKDLREFLGTIGQMRSAESIDILLNGSGNDLLKSLIKRIGIRDKIGGCEIRGVFLANIELDENGKEFLKHTDEIVFVGPSDLAENYVETDRNSPPDIPFSFDMSGFGMLKYIVDQKTKCYMITAKAIDLIRLPGIQNQSLFDLNVRGPLGKTKVNKDIEKTLKETRMHKTFPLFHNGITIVCNFAEVEGDVITINKYYVVNGCQSLTVLYRNASQLTDDLRVMVRIVCVDEKSELTDTITTISNNQNGVKNRDFKSNHIIQVRLQNEIRERFEGRYEYEVKRGEVLTADRIISNEKAGLQLIAFDLKEPWTTHRSYQVFDEKYNSIFGRPEVTGYRLVLLDKLFSSIENKVDKIENALFGKYTLTKYLILYVLRRLFENDRVGREIIENPAIVFNIDNEIKFDKVVDMVLNDVLIDINEETKGLDVEFDYRGKLRDKDYVVKFAGDIVASYEKQISRGRVPSIEEEWGKV